MSWDVCPTLVNQPSRKRCNGVGRGSLLGQVAGERDAVEERHCSDRAKVGKVGSCRQGA